MGIATIHQIASERGTTLRKIHDNDLPTVKTGFEALEKDADRIIFLHRPDYYECDENDDSRRNITELFVLKNTHGGIGTVEICFHPEKLKFMPLEEDPNHGI